MRRAINQCLLRAHVLSLNQGLGATNSLVAPLEEAGIYGSWPPLLSSPSLSAC